MGKLAGALALALTLTVGAFAQSCDRDSIKSVSDDGATIVMESGAVFRVDSSDRADTVSWAVADDVLICKDGGELVNVDEDGERASVVRKR